jgi:single-strand DNA-binding protein
MGRLTKDPEVRYTKGDRPTAVASFSLAVDRRFKREGQADADFFHNLKSFGKTAEFVEKYLHKGSKVVVQGHIQNDNYQGKDGKMVYRDSIYIDAIEFAESKNVSQSANQGGQAPRMTGKTPSREEDNFMNIPDGIAEDELPFN